MEDLKTAPITRTAAHEVASKLGQIGPLPTWLVSAAHQLVILAERTYGPGNGAKKKQFVRNALTDLAESHDIRWLPDAIERPLEAALIDFMVEIAFTWLKDSGLLTGGTVAVEY